MDTKSSVSFLFRGLRLGCLQRPVRDFIQEVIHLGWVERRYPLELRYRHYGEEHRYRHDYREVLHCESVKTEV